MGIDVLVAYPENGDFWLAINEFPAQYGVYVHLNLKELLQRSEKSTGK